MLGLREEDVTQAEVAASIAYCAMQLYYARLVSIELKRMKAVLADYYDLEPGGMVDWMRVSIGALAALAVTVPFFIFLSGPLLAVYGVLFIVAIGYMWWRFVRYNGLSPAVFLKSQRG